MNKIDIKSFLIGVLSISCFLLIMGANNNDSVEFDNIKCNSISVFDDDSSIMSTVIIPGGVLTSNKSEDEASWIAPNGFYGGNYDLDKIRFEYK